MGSLIVPELSFWSLFHFHPSGQDIITYNDKSIHAGAGSKVIWNCRPYKFIWASLTSGWVQCAANTFSLTYSSPARTGCFRVETDIAFQCLFATMQNLTVTQRPSKQISVPLVTSKTPKIYGHDTDGIKLCHYLAAAIYLLWAGQHGQSGAHIYFWP